MKGRGGSVVCYACGLYVTNWQPNDLAALVHFKNFPDRPHMNHLPSKGKWPCTNTFHLQIEDCYDYCTVETKINSKFYKVEIKSTDSIFMDFI